jgi:hypothetical protein
VKWRDTTYLGVPARVGTSQAKQRGKRVQVIHWLADAVGQPTVHPAGTVVVKVASGDFLKGTGRIHEETVYPSLQQAADKIEELSK